MSLNTLTATYFEIFDVPVSFDCDINLIQQRYRELQKTVHPDKFVNASDQEKRISMQQTSYINEAFNTLKNPVERALYLLKLKGLDINFDNETTMDAQFLMEQLELRETLADVGNNAESLQTLDKMRAQINNKLSTLMADFSTLYEADEKDSARELIRKMQFMQKAKKEINDSTASIEDALMS